MAWLTGSQKGKARREMQERVASGEAQLVVGTHAVIQDQVEFARLGLAIIDEQHRFGVQQRLQLRQKLQGKELEPHLLMMSATPIPRTLAMTYYADLDVSTIDELPPGRTPVLTKVFADDKRDRGHRAHPRRGREGPAGVLGVPAHRGKRGARPAATPPRPIANFARRCRTGWWACCMAACRLRRKRP